MICCFPSNGWFVVWKSGNSTRKRPWLRFVYPQAWGKGYLLPVTRTEKNTHWTADCTQLRNLQVKAYCLVGGLICWHVVFTAPKISQLTNLKDHGKGCNYWELLGLNCKFAWANGETLPGSKSKIPRCNPLSTKTSGNGIFSPKKNEKHGGLHTWLSWLAEVRRDLGMAESPYITLKLFFFGWWKGSAQKPLGFDIRCPHWLQLVDLDLVGAWKYQLWIHEF